MRNDEVFPYNRRGRVMCCDTSGFRIEEVDGSCETCGEPTVDGDAYENCGYSPKECTDCGYSPCNLSC